MLVEETSKDFPFCRKMQVIIKEGDLTVIKDLTSEYPSALEVLTAAYDAIARIFPRQSVIDAHGKIDPDSL